MQSTIDHIEDLISKAGDVAETKVELWKLRAAGKISETVSSLIAIIAIVIMIIASVTILSVGIAFWIGTEMGKTSYGFFIVGGFYAFVGLLVYLFRGRWIKTPLSNLIIDKIIK
jgi:ABC-type multidrug transport system fused ATPase/permease subunit